MVRRTIASIPFVAGLLLTAGVGCGGSTPTPVPVAGRVTQDGRPLVNATVAFWWADDSSAESQKGYGLAFSDADGRFSIRDPRDPQGRDGLYPGEYKVTVSLYVDSKGRPLDPDAKPNEVYGGGGAKDLMPVPYRDPRTSPLTVEVPSGGVTDVVLTVPTK